MIELGMKDVGVDSAESQSRRDKELLYQVRAPNQAFYRVNGLRTYLYDRVKGEGQPYPRDATAGGIAPGEFLRMSQVYNSAVTFISVDRNQSCRKLPFCLTISPGPILMSTVANWKQLSVPMIRSQTCLQSLVDRFASVRMTVGRFSFGS